MNLRGHRVAIAVVECVTRTSQPGLGGEMEITGTKTELHKFVVIVPGNDKENRYLHAFLDQETGHWGTLDDGKKYKIHAIEYHPINGAIIRETY